MKYQGAFLTIASVALSLVAFSASALSAKEKQTLEFIAKEFNKVTTVKANFVQTTSYGNRASGRILIKRPGRLRMQYDKPVKNAALIVNSGVTLWWESGRKRNIPTGKTPIKVLVQKNFSFFDKNIDILDYKEDKNYVYVSMLWKPRPQDGFLTITMTKKKPILIKGWSMTDKKGDIVRIDLSNTKFGVTAPNKYFKVNQPEVWSK